MFEELRELTFIKSANLGPNAAWRVHRIGNVANDQAPLHRLRERLAKNAVMVNDRLRLMREQHRRNREWAQGVEAASAISLGVRRTRNGSRAFGLSTGQRSASLAREMTHRWTLDNYAASDGQEPSGTVGSPELP